MSRRARRPRRGHAACALVLLCSAAIAAGGAAAHDRSYWLDLRARQFHVPADQPVLPLALEAGELLGATDPELRDAVGYEALATWIYAERRLDCAQLARLRPVLVAHAGRGLGADEGDGLFLRSFSTLALSVIAAADLRTPCLSPADFNQLLDTGLDALARERDLRGWIPGKGWGHATAHAADLLKFLARSPHLTPPQQARVVEGVAARLQSAGRVFVWGEDARLAAALAAIARRADADPGPFVAWARRLADEHAVVWREPFDPVRYGGLRAALNTLAELAAELDGDDAPGATRAIRTALRELRAATR